MERVTIKDIAREAGVSVAAVSHALNGNGQIKEATRKRILETAERMHYVPNTSAKMLQAGRTKNIGFLVSSMSGPYFLKLIETMQKTCERYGYNMITVYSENPKVIMQHLFGKGIDGAVIYYGQDRIREKQIERIELMQVPTIFLDREIKRQSIGSVVYASYESGVEVTEHLLSLGHKQIFFLAGSEDAYDAQERLRGYKETMEKHGFAVKDSMIFEGRFEEHITRKNVSAYLEQGGSLPDAIIAANDTSAVGCVKALTEHGYRVPEDVSVVSFDDVELAQYFRPALTTVHNPIEMQGERAVEMLMKMMAFGDKKEGEICKLKGNLIIRDSCMKKA